MNNYFNTVVVCLLLILVLILFNLSKKSYLHFKLLKAIYPKKLTKASNYFSFYLVYVYHLDVMNVLWFFVPIYYNRPCVDLDNVEIKFLHEKLLQNRRLFLYLIIFYLVYIIVVSYLAAP